MSYTPHTWTTGETITAAKLNALENGAAAGGGGGGWYPVEFDTETFYIDKSFNELKAAMLAGTIPMFVADYGDGGEVYIYAYQCLQLDNESGYRARFAYSNEGSIESILFVASDPDDPMVQDS